MPFKINAAVRKQLCNSCDVGSPPHNLAKDFSHLNFNHLDEYWWHYGEKDHRGVSVEPEEVLMERAKGFAEYIKHESIHSHSVVT